MFWPIVIISVLFVIGLLLRSFLPRLCAICFAVSLTWLYGLYVGWDVTILALLMGGSSVGFMYYLANVLPERFAVFKLPYLLTAFTVVFLVLKMEFDRSTFLILLGMWLLFGLLFIFRDTGAKIWFRKMVECCKNW